MHTNKTLNARQPDIRLGFALELTLQGVCFFLCILFYHPNAFVTQLGPSLCLATTVTYWHVALYIGSSWLCIYQRQHEAGL